MKKITVLLLSIVCVCCFVFAMTGCNQENKPTDSISIQSNTTNSENSENQGQTQKHEHKYGEWLFDETDHWKECTGSEGECDAEIAELVKHTLDSQSGKCTVCQFQQTVIISYSEITENGKVVAYSVTGAAPKNVTSVSIPVEYNGKPITSIGEKAFYDCESLTSITIPDSVKSIDSSAFVFCPIETATIPASAIKAIRTDYIKTINITSGDTIEDYAFDGCESLTNVTLPNRESISDLHPTISY